MKIPEKLKITNVNIGIVFMAVFSLIYGASSTYVNAMITTIEKRFEFTSAEMGVLMAGNDIGYITCVVFIAYFGSKKNRAPIALSLSAVGMWLSCMIYTLPYYIFGVKYTPDQLMKFNENSTSHTKQFCATQIRNDTNISGPVVSSSLSQEISQSEKSAALFILIIAGIITGIASSPFWNLGIAFLDDMVGTGKTGVYIGILYGSRAFSPILGYLFGAQILKYHESMKLYIDKYLPGQKDQKWIGAWWFGWLLLGFSVLICAPFLLLLRAKGKEKKPEDATEEKEKFVSEENKTEKLSPFKDILRIFMSVLKNRIYLTMILGMIFEVTSLISLLTFFTKFLEFHYRVSPTKSNIYTSIALAGSHVVSIAVSAVVSYFFKTNLRNMSCYHAVVNTLSCALFPILFIFSCDNVQINGLDKLSQSTTCSINCHCQTKKMAPICFNGTMTYYSSCLAGCKTQINSTFFGQCGCSNLDIVKKGFCEEVCPTIYGFLIAFFIIKVIGALAAIQFTQILLRLVPRKDKAVGMSIISLMFGFLGIVLPTLAGSVIDAACRYRDTNDSGVISHCLIYDNEKLRYLIIGVAFVVQIPACVFYILSWLWTPADYKADGDDDVDDNKKEGTEENKDATDNKSPDSIKMSDLNNKTNIQND